MTDKMMDSLKEAFMKDNENASGECPMAEKSTAYAFGELDPNEVEKVKEHIHTCRYCLDLVMDIKMAEQDAEAVMGEKVEVLPSLQKAIDKGKKPSESIWDRIGEAISGFFGPGVGFKPVAAMAVLLLCVGVYFLWDGISPDKPYSIQLMMQGRSQVGFRGGQPEYKKFQVEPGGEIHSGDYFRFKAKIDSDAFVYLVFQDSTGKIGSLEKGMIAGGTTFFIPAGNKWFQLDKNTGTEKVFLLAAKNEIEDFDKKIEELKTTGIGSLEKVFPEATIQSFSFEHR